ncbi:hypothetical protein JOE11_000499 [Robbsia andropogonis]
MVLRIATVLHCAQLAAWFNVSTAILEAAGTIGMHLSHFTDVPGHVMAYR